MNEEKEMKKRNLKKMGAGKEKEMQGKRRKKWKRGEVVSAGK
jgi:ribosomal protein S6E (S10)